MTQRVTEQMVEAASAKLAPHFHYYAGTDAEFDEDVRLAIEAALSAAPASASVAEIDRKRFEKAPCYLCGYNGPGYFQPISHECASRYHAAEVDALFSPASASVAVKPLEWVRSGWVEAFSQAEGLGLWYSIQPGRPSRDPGDPPFGCLVTWAVPGQQMRVELGLDFQSVDEAKAAAQADYERRILSALTTQPDTREAEVASDLPTT